MFAQVIYTKVAFKLDDDIKQTIRSYIRSLKSIIMYIDSYDSKIIDYKIKGNFLNLLFSSFSLYENDTIYYMLPLSLFEEEHLSIKEMQHIIYAYQLLHSPPKGFLDKTIHEKLVRPIDFIEL